MLGLDMSKMLGGTETVDLLKYMQQAFPSKHKLDR
jgi:hypothetical protein